MTTLAAAAAAVTLACSAPAAPAASATAAATTPAAATAAPQATETPRPSATATASATGSATASASAAAGATGTASAAASTPTAAAARPLTTFEIEVRSNAYPATTTVDGPVVVRWKNFTTDEHDVEFKDGTRIGSYKPGQAVERRFDRPGTYAYYCTFHDDQSGVIVVR